MQSGAMPHKSKIIKDWNHPFPQFKRALNRKTMPIEARIALESYYGQRKKCINKNNRWYKYYGGKGVTVDYSAREFVSWWLHHRKKFKGTTATVGRKDHNRSYCFENIEMQDMADNSREAILRNKLNTREKRISSKRLLWVKGGHPIFCFNSIRDAALFFGVSQRLVQFLSRGVYRSSRVIEGKLIPLERVNE